MAETKIEWANFTLNPWLGCTKVSAACDNCYAEAWAKTYAQDVTWGAPGQQSKLRRTSAGTWANAVRWNKAAREAGVNARVFCASLADVFDNDAEQQWRDDLWGLISSTPHLDWLLLTKRPQNIAKMVPDDWGDGYPNVWLGTTVENQTEAERRIPHLLSVPAVVHFLSCEPLLGPLDLTIFRAIDWVIVGGESGAKRRPMDMAWVESLALQCAQKRAAFFFKQDTSHNPGIKGRASDALWGCKQFPEKAA